MSWVTHKKVKSSKKELQLSLPFDDNQPMQDISEYVNSMQIDGGFSVITAEDNFVSRILFQRGGARPAYRFQGGHWSYE